MENEKKTLYNFNNNKKNSLLIQEYYLNIINSAIKVNIYYSLQNRLKNEKKKIKKSISFYWRCLLPSFFLIFSPMAFSTIKFVVLFVDENE